MATFEEWLAEYPRVSSKEKNIIERLKSGQTAAEVAEEFQVTKVSVHSRVRKLEGMYERCGQKSVSELKTFLSAGGDPKNVPLYAMGVSVRLLNVFQFWNPDSRIGYHLFTDLESLFRIQHGHYLRHPNAGEKTWEEIEQLRDEWYPYITSKTVPKPEKRIRHPACVFQARKKSQRTAGLLIERVNKNQHVGGEMATAKRLRAIAQADVTLWDTVICKLEEFENEK